MMVALTELTIKEVWTLSGLEAVKKGKKAWAGLSILCWDSSRMKIKKCSETNKNVALPHRGALTFHKGLGEGRSLENFLGVDDIQFVC